MKRVGMLLLLSTLSSCQVAPPGVYLETAQAPGGAQARATVSVGQSQCATYWLATENLCTELQWIEQPVEKSPTGEFVLRFYHLEEDDSGVRKLVDPKQVPFVKLWMEMENMPPHGSTPIELTRESAGIWRARGVNFVMAGPWQILVQLRDVNDAKKVLDQARGKVRIRAR